MKPIKRHFDQATPDFELLNLIWSGSEHQRRCALTGTTATPFYPVDYHHPIGRGGGNRMFSSPYAVLPLSRAVHSQGWINWPEARGLFLKLARRRVDAAVLAGLYQPSLDEKDRDAGFLDYSQAFLPSF